MYLFRPPIQKIVYTPENQHLLHQNYKNAKIYPYQLMTLNPDGNNKVKHLIH